MPHNARQSDNNNNYKYYLFVIKKRHVREDGCIVFSIFLHRAPARVTHARVEIQSVNLYTIKTIITAFVDQVLPEITAKRVSVVDKRAYFIKH